MHCQNYIFRPAVYLVAVSVLLAVNSITATMYQHPYYQRYQYQYQPRLPRQSPYYLPTQNYIAVPGKIVQQVNEIPISISSPYQNLPLLRAYYELETESSSSPPQGEDSFEPPPSQQPAPGPPMNPPPPPPPENEPEPAPPMMQPPPPPPPENNDHHEMKPSHYRTIHKHVSIHLPPKEFEEEDEQVRIIRPKSPHPDKHINIVFIKAPSPPPQKGKTEIILPETPSQKTLVYVLVKRPDPAEGISVRGPPPTEPPKPQVYFIRYKQNDKKEKEGYQDHDY